MANPPSNLPFEPSASAAPIAPPTPQPTPVPASAPPPIAPTISRPAPPPARAFANAVPPARAVVTAVPPTAVRPVIETAPVIMTPPLAPAPVKKTGGEPEDIFGNLDAAPPSAPKGPAASGAIASSGPSFAKLFLIIMLIVAVLAGLGFAFWYFVIRVPELNQQTSPAVNTQLDPAPSPTPEPSPVPIDEEVVPEAVPDTSPIEEDSAALPPPITTPPPGANIPPPITLDPDANDPSTAPEPEIDTDRDGLSDQREIELGLDPTNPDSDNDGLSDGDEVLRYSTNPVNPDTDGDTFLDGREVQNGFDPRGAGQCAKVDCTP